ARCDGRLLCRSRQPFLDGARELLASGYPASAIVVMKHAGSELEALRSSIGTAARLTVNEDRMRLVRWKAFPSAAGAPSILYSARDNLPESESLETVWQDWPATSEAAS